jgi:hypothetical protein
MRVGPRWKEVRGHHLCRGMEWRASSLSGPVEILRKARMARRVNLELSDGTSLPATMLQVSDAGMALLSIDPKRLSSRDKTHE